MIPRIIQALLLLALSASITAKAAPTNILLITVDDMSCDSVGVFGNPIPSITPNIDRLAAEGMRFEHSHVTVAICQPCRAVLMTGRYPHNSGALGFDPIKPGVPCLPEALQKAGYRTGLMAKHGHVVPSRASAFDEIVPAKELLNGRSPKLFGDRAAAFFAAAKREGKPFFLMANSQDPHRPFIGSQQEANARKRDKNNKTHQYGGGFPNDRIAYAPADVPVPGFLPDLPEIRLELAQYYSSVHRADAIVGRVLKALDDAGLRESTLVVFLSDHGMPLPFAKTNCWHHSTRTPLIVRWPGVATPGTHDTRHLIGGVDICPTLLDAIGVPNLRGTDGRSFVPILRGEQQQNRDVLFTYINTIASKRSYTMRAVVTRDYQYIWNGWHDGQNNFKNESLSGLSWKAMTAAAEENSSIASRVNFYSKRVREELYKTSTDPACLQNLVSDPEQATRLSSLRSQLRDHLKSSGDPEIKKFNSQSEEVSSNSTRPNIVLFVADDLGYAELGCQGNTDIPTPNIDSLARDGVRFTDAYVTAPFCSASRAGLLTGRYQTRFGYEFNPTGAHNEHPDAGLPTSEKTLGDILTQVGYTTALIGKWHLGGTAKYHPQRRGFDTFYGFTHEGHYFVPPPYGGVTTMLRRATLPDGSKNGRWTSTDGKTIFTAHMKHNEPDYDANNPILRSGQPVVEESYLTDALTREALDFIERSKDRPFFLYLPYNAVHSPLQGADSYMQKFSHIDDIHRRIFAAMLANLDDSVGEVLKKLDTEGLRENTLVMFMSDNGGPTRELTSSNAPLRGEKGQVYEGGLRVPFLMRWPGITKRGTTFKYPVTALDIVPTVAAATGARLPKEIYDGVDLTPHLAGDSTKPPHEQLFWRIGNRHALRYGHWKILSQRGRDWELYNLEADIGETKNLSAENSAKLAELIGAWETENTEMIAPIWKP